ncbi:MAG: MT-A70 family methyltransferase [Kiritimatiellia bacterium]
MNNLLPPGPFSVIYADPPWDFKTRSVKGKDGRPQHYDRMSLAQIKALPVAEVADKDCWLFLWTTGPHLPQAFAVIDAWGFKYSGMGFTWIKLNRKATTLFISLSDLFMGGGYTTRKNAEFCLLARRGSPKRISKKVREVLISPVREHSRKPDEFYDRIETFAAGPYLEMFSRTSAPGWSSWGNETNKFVYGD